MIDSMTDPNMSINIQEHQVTLGGQPLKLTRTEYRLLLFLVANSERVVPVKTLAEVMWGVEVDNRAHVRKYVQRLRGKLGDDPREPTWIEMRPRLGYRYIGPAPEIVGVGCRPVDFQMLLWSGEQGRAEAVGTVWNEAHN